MRRVSRIDQDVETGAVNASIHRISGRDGLITSRLQGGAQSLTAIVASHKLVVSWQHCLAIDARELSRAKVTRRHVVELVERRHGKVKGRARIGAGGSVHTEVRGLCSRHEDVAA